MTAPLLHNLFLCCCFLLFQGATSWAIAVFLAIVLGSTSTRPLTVAEAGNGGEAGLGLVLKDHGACELTLAPSAWGHFMLRSIGLGTSSPHILMHPHLLPAYFLVLRTSLSNAAHLWTVAETQNVFQHCIQGSAAVDKEEEVKGSETTKEEDEVPEGMELPSWAQESWLQPSGSLRKPRPEAVCAWGWLEACEGKAVADSAVETLWEQFCGSSYGNAVASYAAFTCLLPGVS